MGWVGWCAGIMIEQAAIGNGKRRLEANSMCVNCSILSMLTPSGYADRYCRLPPHLASPLFQPVVFPESQHLEITPVTAEDRRILTDRRPHPSP